MKYERLAGLIAAPFTAFDAQGEVNLPMIAKQAESLIADGVVGAYICGSTGEGISLSVEERIAVMTAWSEAAQGRLKLIAHTGALALKDVTRLGEAAARLNFFATSVVPPTYFRPGNVRALTLFCREAAAAAPELPFYYYHTMLSGVNLPMVEFLEAAEKEIPNFAGIKFNHFNLHEYQNCRHACGGKFDIVYGVDECFAGALSLGAKAFIGSTYNYAAEIYHAVWRDWRAGNQAEVDRNMHRVCRIVDLLNRYGGLATGKAMMEVKGLPCGNPRLPLLPLAGADREEIIRSLKAILAGELGNTDQ